MAKRDPDSEAIIEQPIEAEPPTVGEQLRTAREKSRLSLEDVAAQTRIPLRHLASLETGEWDNLPAPTYTVGFAKSYASVVGLDRIEIGSQLREEMGGQRFTSSSADVFEPADPARTMPKWLVIGAIGAVILLVVVMSWLNRRSLDQPDQSNQNAAEAPAPALASASNPSAVAQGSVTLTALAPVWIQVEEKGGATLFSGMLQQGQGYAVPATAAAPVLKTGKPEALRITVGNTVAAPVGPPATTVTNVSLLGPDLLRSPAPGGVAAAQPAASAPVTKPVSARSRPGRARPVAALPPPPAPSATAVPGGNVTQ